MKQYFKYFFRSLLFVGLLTSTLPAQAGSLSALNFTRTRVDTAMVSRVQACWHLLKKSKVAKVGAALAMVAAVHCVWKTYCTWRRDQNARLEEQQRRLLHEQQVREREQNRRAQEQRVLEQTRLEQECNVRAQHQQAQEREHLEMQRQIQRYQRLAQQHPAQNQVDQKLLEYRPEVTPQQLLQDYYAAPELHIPAHVEKVEEQKLLEYRPECAPQQLLQIDCAAPKPVRVSHSVKKNVEQKLLQYRPEASPRQLLQDYHTAPELMRIPARVEKVEEQKLLEYRPELAPQQPPQIDRAVPKPERVPRSVKKVAEQKLLQYRPEVSPRQLLQDYYTAPEPVRIAWPVERVAEQKLLEYRPEQVNAEAAQEEKDVEEYDFTPEERHVRFIQETDALVYKKLPELECMTRLACTMESWRKIAAQLLREHRQVLGRLSPKSAAAKRIKIEEIKERVAQLEKLDAAGPWTRGKVLVESLTRNEDEIIHVIASMRARNNSDENIKDMCNLTWYFYVLAAQKGQAFTKGTFFVQDRFNGIFNYVQAMPQTYTRISSHIKTIRRTEYGIDIPLEKRDDDAYLLPNNNYTILFSSLRNGYTFIKPEQYGMNLPVDKAYHTVHYGASLYRKFYGGDEGQGLRKEHTPESVTRAFNAFVQAVWLASRGKYDTDINNLLTKKCRWIPGWVTWWVTPGVTLGCIKNICTEILDLLSLMPDERAKNQDLMNAYNAVVGLIDTYDHSGIRYGNEVILDTHELRGEVGLILTK